MLTFNDCASLPVLRTLLHIHGATLLIAAAVAADAALERGDVRAEHLSIMAEEVAGHLAEAAVALTPMQRVALCGSSCEHHATRYLARSIPEALMQVLTALCGEADAADTPLFGAVFAAIHDYGLTCHSVDVTPNWVEFMQYSLSHPVTA